MNNFRIRAGLIALAVAGLQMLSAAADGWMPLAKAVPGDWSANSGAEFPGGKTTLLAVDPAAENGPEAGAEVDLSHGGQYGGLLHAFTLDEASPIRFEILSEGVTGISIRVTGQDNQTHVTSIEVSPGRRQLIELPLDQKGFPRHWGGSNDGVFRFPLKTIAIVADRVPAKKGKFFLYDVQVVSKKKDEVKPPDAVYLRIADGMSEKWQPNIGLEFFPGSSAIRTYRAAEDDTPAVELAADLTRAGRYGALDYPLSQPESSRVKFTLRSLDVDRLDIRIQGDDFQVHSTSLPVKPGEWRTIELPLDRNGFPGHWGGPADGVFRFPLRNFQIAVDSPAEKKGTFQVRDLFFAVAGTAVTPGNAWQLEIHSSVPGNIVFHGEPLAAEIRLANQTASPRKAVVEWTVIDQNGTIAAQGRETAALDAFGSKTFVPEANSLDYGYYRLSVSLLEHGAKISGTEKYFGVVRRLPNFGKTKDPDSFFGLQLGDIFDPAAAARIGVKWDRLTRVWLYSDAPIPPGEPSGYDRPYLAMPRITPGAKEYHWPDDTSVTAGNENGISLMMTVCYEAGGTKAIPPGECAFPPSKGQLEEWKKFVTACALRYGPHIDAWEIQNEAENTLYIMAKVSAKTGIDTYSAVIRSAREALRRAGSDLPIVALDINGGHPGAETFMNGVMEKTGADIDIFTAHPYAYPRYFGPGKSPILPVPSGMDEKLQEGLRRMKRYGQGDKPLWVGEIGYAVDRTVPIDSRYTRDFAAAVAQGLTLIHSVPEVKRCIWFIQDGCNEGGFEYGLWRGNPFRGQPLQPLPGAVAYATCARLLYHVDAERRLNIPGVIGCAFLGHEKDRAVAVLWTEDAEDVLTFAFDPPAGTEITDMYGRDVKTQRFKLGKEPIYFTSSYASANQLLQALEKVRPEPLNPLRVESVYCNPAGQLNVRVKNLLARPAEIGLAVPGGSTKNTLAARETATLRLPVPSDADSLAADLLLDGVKQQTLAIPLDFMPCPYRKNPFGTDSAEWGAPQAVLKSRLDILPPDLNIGWGGPDDLSAEAWWGWNETGFALAVRVRDDVHKAEDAASPERFWMGDSLQVAFDVDGDAAGNGFGFAPDDREFGFALGGTGACAYRVFPEMGAAKAPFSVTRQGGSTVYRALIPWRELGIDRPDPDKIIGFSFIANDNDGNGRKCWIGLTPGIGEYKQPGKYRKLRLLHL